MVLEEVKESVGKMKTNKEGKGSGGDIEMIVCGKLEDFFFTFREGGGGGGGGGSFERKWESKLKGVDALKISE